MILFEAFSCECKAGTPEKSEQRLKPIFLFFQIGTGSKKLIKTGLFPNEPAEQKCKNVQLFEMRILLYCISRVSPLCYQHDFEIRKISVKLFILMMQVLNFVYLILFREVMI